MKNNKVISFKTSLFLLLTIFTLFSHNISLNAQSVSYYPIPGLTGSITSVATAELDGNVNNGNEIAASTIDGTVSVVRSDGSLLWSREVPNRNCKFSPINDKLYSSPAIGALFGGTEQYVVIGYGGYRGQACDGGVIAFRGSDGVTAWTFSIKDWASKMRYKAFRNTVYTTPTLSDVDGDGTLEIGFGSFDRNVYLLNSNGTVRWYYNAADTVYSSPTFIDIDNDGRKEMIIGTDITKNTRLKPPTPDGGYIYALRTNPKSKSKSIRFKFRSPEIQIWRNQFDQVAQSSPIAAELVSSNPGLEIVLGTGCFFPQKSALKRGRYYNVISASTGRILRTLPVTSCTPSTPSVGDIDGDGLNEVVVAVSGDPKVGGDGISHVIGWKPDQNIVVWDTQPKLSLNTDLFAGNLNRSPLVRDLNKDGRLEVTIPYSNGIVILNGLNGGHISCDTNPCTKPLFFTGGYTTGTPILSQEKPNGLRDILFLGQQGQNPTVVRLSPTF